MAEGMARRIKELRQERGLTLEQVAVAVGVGRSTVRKWETGMIANMKRDKIADLAKVLGTTPGYLMGWEEEEPQKENSPSERQLTEGEKVLLDLFNRVPEDKQQLVLQMIRAALGTQE
jgi:transcriptional regulator with XRE-family HTH domain